MLEAQSSDEHRLTELLRSLGDGDAFRILQCLRAGDDVHSIVDFAQDLFSSSSATASTVSSEASFSNTAYRNGQDSGCSYRTPALRSTLLMSTSIEHS
jgi:hypothetical protein